LAQQRQWLIDLEHLLDPPEPSPNGAAVANQVDKYLVELRAAVTATGDEFDHQAVHQIDQTFRNRWWGLFICYQVAGLPRTNNELETFLRRIKANQRRITGRKNVHDFVVRYGCFAAFIDDRESQDELLARLRQVNYADFARERQQLVAIQEQIAKRYRFRHRRQVILSQLETDWATALAAASTNS
jgi:hypothetical protein